MSKLPLRFAVALAFLSCTPTVHPNDPGIPRAICSPQCEREHECDAQVNVVDCENRCEHLLSPRIVYERADLVAEMRDCALRQACTGNVNDGIRRCQADASRRLEPSQAARTYCANTLNKYASCRASKDQSDDYAHCIDGHKMYSDAILAQLDECNDGPCRARSMCTLDVVGHDEVTEDEDFQKKRRAMAVQDAGRATISFHGVITSETPRGPVPGATVCLQGTQQCATASADGSYTLPTPAHAEVAVRFEATGFESFVNPLTTVGRDVEDSPVIQGVDLVKTRFAAVQVNAPDPATGMLFVKARTMEDKPKGIEGISFAIDGAPERTPWYSQPDGAISLDLKATSTRGVATFVGFAPGDVELTATGPGVVCTPGFWAWPSQHANSIRAPIVAGATTVVVMQCHR